ncbi:MAG: histidinol dehydrogenase [Phycisphaerae bacterium]|nr:histidinol dehydrogenase [Phycisphaerae bacterium]
MISVIRESERNFESAVRAVRDRLRGGGVTGGGESGLDVAAAVREILADIAARGDDAVVAHERRLDQVGESFTAADIRVPAARIRQAHGDVAKDDPDFLALMRRVAANIREYQQAILQSDPPPLRRGGRTLGVRYTPVSAVGVYVPGGRALYPSTVLMTVVPAQVAGVERIAMASPPTTAGDIHPMVLAIAHELGVDEVYRVGGAVAVGALAYGTASVAPVDKIVGPGNAFVAEAKRQVMGRVGIDSIAGPSEVLIVADETASPAFVAADMLAQAEHDPGSAVLVTTSGALADAVLAALAERVSALSRRDAIAAALRAYSAIFVVKDLARACEIANDFATEHLQIQTADDERTLKMIRHAGAIFVGPHTPVPLGDYYAGPSHVLPTGSTARFFSALSCNDFRKASSVIAYDRASLLADAADVADFATREGLTAHAAAVRIRKPETRNPKSETNSK